jgi:hypothetical protein
VVDERQSDGLPSRADAHRDDGHGRDSERLPPVLPVPVRTIAVVVWSTVATLVAATFAAQLVHEHVHGTNNGDVALFDSNEKLNFPSEGKIVLLLYATVLLAVLGGVARTTVDRLCWLGMASVFVLLSTDEMTYLHQRLSNLLHDHLHTHGPLRFAWVAVYVPILLALAIVYWPFWRRLADPLRTRLLVAAVCFAGGAAGVEPIKATLYHDLHWTLAFGLAAAVSDSLELVGLALLTTTLLAAVGHVAARVTLAFR